MISSGFGTTKSATCSYPDNAVVEDVVEVEESFILPEEISSVSRCRLCLTVPADNEANAVDLFATPDGQEEPLHKTLLQFFQIEVIDTIFPSIFSLLTSFLSFPFVSLKTFPIGPPSSAPPALNSSRKCKSSAT